MDTEEIKTFLDERGRILSWPSKMKKKLLVLEYLSTKFNTGVEYSEKEVNSIINQWHIFNDYFILRRGLIDMGLLEREKDGSKYWKPKKREDYL